MSKPILQFLKTDNYKNLRLDKQANIKNLNILIGANGSGKSNFISCLKFLKDCLTRLPDESRGVSSFEDAAQKKQIIVTTYSPDLLDHFTDCLENVLCFASENRTHFSIKPLSKPMLESKLEEGWQLGDLYRVGDPSIGGWPW